MAAPMALSDFCHDGERNWYQWLRLVTASLPMVSDFRIVDRRERIEEEKIVLFRLFLMNSGDSGGEFL